MAMDEETARRIARDLIGPAGLLGYFCGRGQWYSNDAHRQRWTRAVGNVMGHAYLLLAPVWKVHPQLDPGRGDDSLGLAHRTTSLTDTSADMSSLLGELQLAGRQAATMIERLLPSSTTHTRTLLADFNSAVRTAVALLSETEQGAVQQEAGPAEGRKGGAP